MRRVAIGLGVAALGGAAWMWWPSAPTDLPGPTSADLGGEGVPPKPAEGPIDAEPSPPPKLPPAARVLHEALVKEAGGGEGLVVYYHPKPVKKATVSAWPPGLEEVMESPTLRVEGPGYVMVADPLGALLPMDAHERLVGTVDLRTRKTSIVRMLFAPRIEHQGRSLILHDHRDGVLVQGEPPPQPPVFEAEPLPHEEPPQELPTAGTGTLDGGAGDEGGSEGGTGATGGGIEPGPACPPRAHFIGVDVDGVDPEIIESVRWSADVARRAGFDTFRVIRAGTAEEPSSTTVVELLQVIRDSVAEIAATGCECPGSIIVVHTLSHGWNAKLYVGSQPEGWVQTQGAIFDISTLVAEVAEVDDFGECVPLLDIFSCGSGNYHVQGPPPDPLVVITSTQPDTLCSFGDLWIHRDCYYLLAAGAIGIDDYLACIQQGIDDNGYFDQHKPHLPTPKPTMSPAAPPQWRAQSPEACCYKCMCTGALVPEHGGEHIFVEWVDSEERLCEPPPFRPQAYCMEHKLCEHWRGKPAPLGQGLPLGTVYPNHFKTWHRRPPAKTYPCQ